MNAERARNLIAAAAGRALLCAPLLLLSGLADARAQSDKSKPKEQPPARDSRGGGLRVELPQPVAETPVPFEDGGRARSLQTLSFTTPDAGFERRLVRGAPFSADATTEHTQTLGDGNRMARKSAARLFRDSAGRTRREHSLARGGAAAAGGEEPRLIVINDPVGQVNYVIDTRTNTARKMQLSPGLMEARERALGGESSFGVLVPAHVGRRRVAEGDSAPPPPAPKTERLETQVIEGVTAEGTRTTVTIPAGEFDNEQPMEITHEQWYSPELQTVVLMRHTDPRFGETTYRLTNVSRGEPDRSLFELPDGVKVASPAGPRPFPAGPRDFPARRLPPPGRP